MKLLGVAEIGAGTKSVFVINKQSSSEGKRLENICQISCVPAMQQQHPPMRQLFGGLEAMQHAKCQAYETEMRATKERLSAAEDSTSSTLQRRILLRNSETLLYLAKAVCQEF